MAKASKDTEIKTQNASSTIKEMQFRYVLVGFLLIPFMPFFYLQGKYTRWKVGKLPDAEGDTSGTVYAGANSIRLLAIGESSVAGVGVKSHSEALTGQFAKHLSQKTGKTVYWNALGESGITVRRTIEELVPKIPEVELDIIVVALGGNDVFGAKSPQTFRANMSTLLSVLRKRYPDARIFLANVPMVRDFIALPHPLKYVLSRLAKIHHFNTADLVSGMENVFYFEDVERVEDGFFSDGIHPSAKGYDLWTESMVCYFLECSE